jgi:small subunit ribosomal protein S20
VEKRKRQSDKANLRNKMIKSKLKTAKKKLEMLIEKKETESITALFNEYVSLVDRATSGGVIHRNNASRKKAWMARKINSVQAPKQPAATETQPET